MILMIDNYDSFVYNLVQYFGELGEKIVVYRNDKLTIKKVEKLKFDRIVISPGPKRPQDAGISCEIIERFKEKVPILGVCLGHQCIGYVFGGKITYAKKIMHGKTSLIYHNQKEIFEGIENPFIATRYHSLVIEKESLPICLEIIAWTDDDEIMGVKHKEYKIFGVQFHPESILTKEGKKILKNFLKIK
ncbi:MAG: aminodeoxychorismate/anthranilate synthase component II [Candidatus Omnitrophica bacterium]|nr:aminodeoxychorismate/anthranilate synthase component II [Candidatus Omnitrophota bacterium]MCM8803293.1 aminodeoxychorismate/anthranilate synthase component II [Candidatus Omnitrophota bacterium]